MRCKNDARTHHMAAFVIVPTVPTYKRALATLLASMDAVGFPRENVIPVVGLMDGDGVVGRAVHLRRNLYENNAFFGVKLLRDAGAVSDDDVFLLLHDTACVGSEFPARLDAMVSTYQTHGYDVLWMCAGGLFNICLFNTKTADAVCDRLGDMMAVDKLRAIDMEHGKDPDSIKRIEGLSQGCVPWPFVSRGVSRVYGDVERNAAYIPSIDIEKYHVPVVTGDRPHPHLL